MSESTVMERPVEVAEVKLNVLRITAQPRRMWRVWDILDNDLKVKYTSHGAWGWKDTTVRGIVVEVEANGPKVAEVIDRFELFRFKAVPFTTPEESMETQLGVPFPVDEDRPAANVERNGEESMRPRVP